MTAEIIAGAAGPHGRHERPDEGWDEPGRKVHAHVCGLDADAHIYGRHAAAPTAADMAAVDGLPTRAVR